MSAAPAKKTFDAYYAIKEADVTEAQIAAFCDAVRRMYEAKNVKLGGATGYVSVPFLNTHEGEMRTLAADCGFDLDTFGNEEAVRHSAAWAEMVAPFKAANEAWHARRAAEVKAAKEASLEAVCEALSDNPAIVRAIRAAAEDRHAPNEFKIRDMDLNRYGCLSRPNNPYGGNAKPFPAYTSVAKPSGCKLDTKRTVAVYSSQEAYADYTHTLIPVIVTGAVDEDQARKNLGYLADALQTHNGWAGSGSTYSFALHLESDGAYVVMAGRHSISD